MPSTDPLLPLVFSRDRARGAGLTDRQIDRRLAGDRWRPQRRGWLRSSAGPGSVQDEFAAELIAAARSIRTREVVVSHLSAARFWGFPKPLSGWAPPTFTTPAGATRYRGDRRILVAPLADREVVRVGGIAITSPARTLADCLRSLRPRDGLAMADAAAHVGRVTVPELAEAVERQAGWQGVRAARSVLALVDGRRESTLESWSAWSFDRLDVPPPRWQLTVEDDRGHFLGRVDGWWEQGVVGEADGRSKYRLAAEARGGVSAKTLAAVLHQERERERALRASGADVQRWGPSDVLVRYRAEDLARRLRAALDFAARHPRFTGRAR